MSYIDSSGSKVILETLCAYMLKRDHSKRCIGKTVSLLSNVGLSIGMVTSIMSG